MSGRLVTIARFAYSADPVSEAELARIKLEAEGMPCFLGGKNFTGVYWLASLADRGVKLQVRESDSERAKEILNRHEKVRIDESECGDSTEGQEPRCPRCGSEDITYERFSRKAFYLGVALFRFPLPYLKKKCSKCVACGHVWK